MKKAEKIFFVDNLTEELKGAKSVVLINFIGMGVKAQQNLKKQLKAVGAKMIVVKNTLLKIAAKKAKIDESILEDSILTGQTALILTSDDALSPIQVLGKFAKEFEIPQMKIGIVEGTLTDAASLTHISSLPGRDALLGQLLGALMAPSYGLVSTLNAGPSRLVSMLDAKAKAN
jgi:large subunit ribosomal protein L10